MMKEEKMAMEMKKGDRWFFLVLESGLEVEEAPRDSRAPMRMKPPPAKAKERSSIVSRIGRGS